MKTALITGPNMLGILSARSAPMIGYAGAYANSLTALIPTLYAAMDTVSRELVGFIPSVTRNASAERVAVGQTVSYPIAPSQVAYDVTPAMAIPEPPDNTIGTGTMAITKSRAVPFGFTGEEQRALNTGGPGYLNAQGMLVAQALRTLTNEAEADLAATAAAGASRAWGTAGTTPFAPGGATPLTDSAFLRKILDDNGAPATGRSLIINTSAGANLRSVPNLTRVNESGTQMTLRDGALLDIHGFFIKESGQAITHVTSTGAGVTTNAAGYAVGATVITLAAAGTGNITAGEVVTFAGDTNKYVVATGDADTSNGGTIVLQAPGLRVAIPAAATAITKSATYAANVAFSQDAIQAAYRAPALPEEGDLRIDSFVLVDPRSGLPFEFSVWPGYRKVRGEVALAWGQAVVKNAHVGLLLG